MTELAIKQSRLAEFLSRASLDGVLLTQRANFSWMTGGRYNRISNNATLGACSILATPDKLICLANDIEAPRMRQEEFAGTDIQTISFPWWDPAAASAAVAEVIAGRKIAADGDDFGLRLPPLPHHFAELRWSLTPEEIARYRQCGRLASAAMEQASQAIAPGITEHQAAGALDKAIHDAGLNPLVTLIASDERIANFRHPIATAKKINRHVMLVTCADLGGLISCLTRVVYFGSLPAEIAASHQKICEVDAAVIRATRPGRTLGQIFDDLRAAYDRAGYPDQWRHHHQGGSTGYANRDALGMPGNPVTVRENQPFAWNPSITGVKSEDTLLATSSGQEILTSASAQWPGIEVQGIRRPGILQR